MVASGNAFVVSDQRQKGADWLNQNCGKGGGYSHVMPPNSRTCFFSDSNGSKTCTMVGASSYHSGGVNVCFLDRTVRFVKNSVSQQAWWAIATSLAPSAPGLGGAVPLIGLAASAHEGFSANLYTLASDMFPRRAVG